MAIRNIALKNFKNVSCAEHKIPNLALIRGKNGAGKSTIKDAIAFCFCGTDADGNRNPQHLISWGSTSTEVTITTDKAIITRKLTDKNIQTLKLLKGDVSTILTQTQMEQMVGTTDAFLSTFNVGYFFRLPQERQHKVLSELTPPVDRRSILQGILGWELTDEETVALGLSRRADLIASTAATKRRVFEKDEANVDGQIMGLRTLGHQDPPAEPAEHVAVMNRQSMLKKLWDEFQYKQERFLAEEANRLRQQLKLEPARPILSQEMNWENCPTCGQIVGAKHREKVTKMNMDAQEQYDRTLQEVRSYNESIKEKLDAVTKDVYLTKAEGKQVIAGAPAETYSAYAFYESEKEVSAYMQKLSGYRLWEEQTRKAQENVATLQEKLIHLQNAAQRYSLIERAASALPEHEFKLQQEALRMPLLKIEMTDRLSIFYNQKPYESLSDGQKIQAGIELTIKFNSLMKRPLGFIFVDNADLVDNQDCLKQQGIQWLLARVMPGQELQINEP